jgi:hypothetical protein
MNAKWHDTSDQADSGRLKRLRGRLQAWLWRPDEALAADRGWDVRRSRSGWSITVRDARWDTRQECSACAGAGCDTCALTGVITVAAEDRRVG